MAIQERGVNSMFIILYFSSPVWFKALYNSKGENIGIPVFSLRVFVCTMLYLQECDRVRR